MSTPPATPRVAADLTVNETVRDFPTTVEVFHRLGIDACCGGGLPVGEAAARHGLDPDEVLDELNRAAGAG